MARRLFVTGDASLDVNFYRATVSDAQPVTWSLGLATRTREERRGGGALFLRDIVTEFLKDHEDAEVTGPEGSPAQPVPLASSHLDESTSLQLQRSYCLWLPFRKTVRQTNDERVWRIDQFLGVELSNDRYLPTPPASDSFPDVVLIDDGNLGFRQARGIWQEWLQKFSHAQIILKTTYPVAEQQPDHALWRALQDGFTSQLLVVIPAEDMRHCTFTISRSLSWERTALDLRDAVMGKGHGAALRRCRHLIITFETAGALHFDFNSTAAPRVTLYYDPSCIENTWNESFEGRMVGYASLIAGGLANALVRVQTNDTRAAIEEGIQDGLQAARALHFGGHGPVNTPGDVTAAPQVNLGAVVAGARANSSRLCTVEVPLAGPWSILRTSCKTTELALQSAEKVALYGPEIGLPRVPAGQFHDLISLDPDEIRAYRDIRNLIQQYRDGQDSPPISIAVFGPPGSGKSFAVKQIARSVGYKAEDSLEFNLSQFGVAADLLKALHQVRDQSLKGRPPLVFWDEFDSALGAVPLGWLRYFLAPMQDGRFQEGEITHPVGRAIFVFAGGTSGSWAEFSARDRVAARATSALRPAFGRQRHRKLWGLKGARVGVNDGAARAAKLPDFTSRLRGYLDLKGIDPAPGDPGDTLHFVRRALLLRQLLKRRHPGLFHMRPLAEEEASDLRSEGNSQIPARVEQLNIDVRLLQSFLLTEAYYHGARSMEAVIGMSRLNHARNYEGSHLPSAEQLLLHVNPVDFLSRADL